MVSRSYLVQVVKVDVGPSGHGADDDNAVLDSVKQQGRQQEWSHDVDLPGHLKAVTCFPVFGLKNACMKVAQLVNGPGDLSHLWQMVHMWYRQGYFAMRAGITMRAEPTSKGSADGMLIHRISGGGW